MNSMGKAQIYYRYGEELSKRPWKFAGLGSRTRMIARVVLAAALLLVLAAVHYFEKFVQMQQSVFAQGSRMEVERRRRENLIPRLEAIATAYARHEQGLMNYVADARALQKSSQELRGALGPEKAAEAGKALTKLIALAERYPDLKADRSYQTLMAKNVATENRVAAARLEYVALINQYNRTMKSFPDALFAKIFRFEALEAYVPDKDPAPVKNKRIFFIY